MDTYTFTLMLGGAGLVAMAATGAAHMGGGGGHGGTHDVHAGHGHDFDTAHTGHFLMHGGSGHAASHHTAHVITHDTTHAGIQSGTHDTGFAAGLRSIVLPLASPRALFGLLFGFGVTGMLVRPLLPGPVAMLLPVIALGGALVLEFVCIRPIWSLMLRFVSTPAQTLESALMGDAQATSGFDANGEGLVAIEVDGQIVQCLGRLREEDRAQRIRVRAGDLLRVTDIDAARQRCTVAYVGHSQLKSQ